MSGILLDWALAIFTLHRLADLEFWSYRGVILYALERYEEAIRCFERYVEINPVSTESTYSKGDLNRADSVIKDLHLCQKLKLPYSKIKGFR